jgi:aconitase A
MSYDPAAIERWVDSAQLTVEATSLDGTMKSFTVQSRVDDSTDLEYVRQGGILHQVLRERLAAN